MNIGDKTHMTSNPFINTLTNKRGLCSPGSQNSLWIIGLTCRSDGGHLPQATWMYHRQHLAPSGYLWPSGTPICLAGSPQSQWAMGQSDCWRLLWPVTASCKIHNCPQTRQFMSWFVFCFSLGNILTAFPTASEQFVSLALSMGLWLGLLCFYCARGVWRTVYNSHMVLHACMLYMHILMYIINMLSKIHSCIKFCL